MTDLSRDEKLLILMALEHEPFREEMSEPVTPRVVRDMWRGLRDKLKKPEGNIIVPTPAEMAKLLRKQ